MRTMVRAAGLAAVAVLASCASAGPQIEIAQRAQTELVGMPKGQLLSCAGVPERQAAAEGAEYLTYVAPPTYSGGGPNLGLGVGGGSGGVGLGVGLGFPLFGGGGSSSPGCDATFMLRGDVVQRVTYPAGADLARCGAILANCVPAR